MTKIDYFYFVGLTVVCLPLYLFGGLALAMFAGWCGVAIIAAIEDEYGYNWR
jgi:hypothetical protein